MAFGLTTEETLQRVRAPASIPDEDIRVRLFAMDERVSAEWAVNGVGFGQFYIDLREDGSIRSIDSETMSREFIKRLLCWAVDNAKEVG